MYLLKSLKRIIYGITMICLICFTSTSEAAVLDYVYKAPGGLKIISYSPRWNDINKLKDVYEELLKNTHGEELKLLKKITIYDGPSSDGPEVQGKWFGKTETVNGRIRLADNRYIEIYNGNQNDTVAAIARTISHEYGHHFTYYYYYKTENKPWESWRETKLSKIRNIKGNTYIGVDNNEDHMWQIQEIVAEDYVQLFGSSTGKVSYDFLDNREWLSDNSPPVMVSGDTFNYCPQENYTLPLAANVKGLREYWLTAAGLKMPDNNPPSQVTLKLKEVKSINRLELRQYIISWDKSTDDKTKNLEYTLVAFGIDAFGNPVIDPVKTVTDSEELEAVFGAARLDNYYAKDDLLDPTFFVVYIKDEDGLFTSSKVLAVDFTNYDNPQTVLVDDLSRANGVYGPFVIVNGKQLEFDVNPVIKDGRTLVPLRDIFENLGATVEWDSKTRTITAKSGENEVVLTIGSKTAAINGTEIDLETPPQIINGKTLVPLRFVSEALGANVTWNDKLDCALITN